MNERFGSFSTFFTTNFADTYHVLTQVLAQGAFEPLGKRPMNILQDSPVLQSTLEDMHKIVASRPMVQCKLFLLLDALTHQHLICTRNVFLGRRKYDPACWQGEPVVEDDFASSGDFGIGARARADQGSRSAGQRLRARPREAPRRA